MQISLRSLFIFLSFYCFVATETAWAQAAATVSTDSASGGATGIVQEEGTLNYSLGISETIIAGYQGSDGIATSTNFTGAASLITSSETRPTSLIYSGGYLLSSTPGQPSATYQNLGLSQVIMTKNWNLSASNFVSYMPSSPTTGLSGIAGIGDLNTVPAGTFTGDNILSYYSTRIANNASANAERKLTGSTTVEASGSYAVQRFLGDLGTDNSSTTGSMGLQHRLGERSVIGGNYSYTRFDYGASPAYYTGNFSFHSQSANFTYEHTFSRKLSSSFSVGPQWTRSSYSSATPARISFAATAAISYAGRATRTSLNYSRGANSGSGVVPGIDSDNLGVMVQRTLNQRWSGAISGNYAHTTGIFSLLSATPTTHAFYGGVQVSRQIGHDFSAYLSYTAQTQTVSNIPAAGNAFGGLTQVIGAGLRFSPTSVHLGRR